MERNWFSKETLLHRNLYRILTNYLSIFDFNSEFNHEFNLMFNHEFNPIFYRYLLLAY